MAASKRLHTVVDQVQRRTTEQLGFPAKFVNHPGCADLGTDAYDGMVIDPDADGEFGTKVRFVYDLSHALSYQLGKQLPMDAIYRIKKLQLQLNNDDDPDVGGDNTEQVVLQGRMYYLSPNAHNIEAIQMARKSHRNLQSIQIDGESSLFGTEAQEDYKGFRFGYLGDGDVLHQTAEEFGVAGASWTLFGGFTGLGIIDNWNDFKNLTPDMDRNLWDQRVGQMSSIAWSASSCGNPGASTPAFDWTWEAGADNHIDVVGGLLVFDVLYCSTDNTIVNQVGVQVGAAVEGWESI